MKLKLIDNTNSENCYTGIYIFLPHVYFNKQKHSIFCSYHSTTELDLETKLNLTISDHYVSMIMRVLGIGFGLIYQWSVDE